jgi:hypothetical protein
MMSAAASLGLSLLWDTDLGLSHIDKYTYSAEEHIKVRSYCVKEFSCVVLIPPQGWRFVRDWHAEYRCTN